MLKKLLYHRWANGDVYTGDWRRGRQDGYGEFKHATTDETYIGEFKNGQRSGFGTIYYPNNSSFVGMFQVGFKSIFCLKIN